VAKVATIPRKTNGMKYKEFEKIISQPRLNRYLVACNGKSKKAMTLYRLNLRLSHELFTTISCFEVTLRNAIDQHYQAIYGADWLRDAVQTGGMFDNRGCRFTTSTIQEVVTSLGTQYAHSRVVAGLGFGFWRYLFAQNQFQAGGRTLLRIFPAKPRSTVTTQYNQNYVFNRLAEINEIRNRIAHHEPICFRRGRAVKDTTFARQHYTLILQLFQWMSIDAPALLYGLDHINRVCSDIDAL
jgi:hypothetical protein